MRTAFVLSGLAGLAAAIPAPAPQLLNLAVFDAAPKTLVTPAVTVASQTVAYNTASAVASATNDPIAALLLSKRQNGDCAPQPSGAGYVPSPDTDSGFETYYEQDQNIDDAEGYVNAPENYIAVFDNLQASYSGYAYLGLYTLSSYSVYDCAFHCDAVTGCVGFNIYFERDPSVNPAAACPNPPSTTNIKCTLWGLPVTPAGVTNTGQWRGPEDANGQAFHVVIAGSNGYNKPIPAPTVPSFDAPASLGDAAINAPSGYLGVKFFSQPYDPNICAAACTSQTTYDKETASNGVYDPCNYFNIYILYDNGLAQGFYCSLYTIPEDPSYATNVGQYRGSDHYTISDSYGYTLDPQDPGTTS
ncbi:MAG: hypothetical protein M1827_003142 [Pycnora praestabilis]|nr:MAG: hypothetical protein M1827_003142 [Pycnora praestabilis]